MRVRFPRRPWWRRLLEKLGLVKPKPPKWNAISVDAYDPEAKAND